MLIFNWVFESREINNCFMEFSFCFDSSKLWQFHSLIYELIENKCKHSIWGGACPIPCQDKRKNNNE